MRNEPSKRNAEQPRYRPTCTKMTGRRMRTVAMPNAMDAPDPTWLPEAIEEWDLDTEIVDRYTSP